MLKSQLQKHNYLFFKERIMSEEIYKYEQDEVNPQAAIVKLNANVTGGNDALSLQKLITELIDSDFQTLLVDMANVNIINSSGLGMLISAYSHLKKANKELKLINVPGKVLKLLQITQFDKIFDI